MIVTEDEYLAHYGVKGMQWGVRKQQAASAARTAGRGAAVAGKAAWKGAKAVGRGTEKAAIWTKNHPKQAAAIAAGALYVGLRIRGKVKNFQANRKLAQVVKARQTAKGAAFAKTTFRQKVDLSTPFRATTSSGKQAYYQKYAEEAFRKAGAFGKNTVGLAGRSFSPK